MFIVTKQKIQSSVGMMSLVGVGSERPVSWGNYFSFSSGPRCVNMWAENLEHLRKTIALQDVECFVYEENQRRWALVVDERVPVGYLYDSCCFTGYYVPSLEIILDMIDRQPLLNKEKLREYTDRDAWLKENGWTERNGIMSKKIEVKSRQLQGTWTCS